MSDFQDKVNADKAVVKKMIFKEEAKSAFMATLFGLNVMFAVCNPFTLLTVVNAGCAWFVFKQFRPTVRKQMELEAHMNFLNTVQKEKVWTPED